MFRKASEGHQSNAYDYSKHYDEKFIAVDREKGTKTIVLSTDYNYTKTMDGMEKNVTRTITLSKTVDSKVSDEKLSKMAFTDLKKAAYWNHVNEMTTKEDEYDFGTFGRKKTVDDREGSGLRGRVSNDHSSGIDEGDTRLLAKDPPTSRASASFKNKVGSFFNRVRYAVAACLIDLGVDMGNFKSAAYTLISRENCT